MKIVQTFWTKPALRTWEGSTDRLAGGWSSNVTHYMSWALSCHQLCKYYSNVELYTDELGKQILIDLLKLPYTDVHVTLDQLNAYGSDLWALGKIFTYSKQTSPFLHVDSDVFIWKKFDDEIEQAQLVCQNFDCNQTDYFDALEWIEKNGFFIPRSVLDNRALTSDIHSCNAGILGGNDISFFRNYTMQSFEFVNRNLSRLTSGNFPSFNILFEQYLFYCLARQEDIGIMPYFKEIDYGGPPKNCIQFWGVPHRSQYVHVVAGFKKFQSHASLVATLLRDESPELYFRINQLAADHRL